jgi:hypothetical protein
VGLEIRPVTRDEAVEYLKVLPFANGLPWWEPYPAAWHGGEAAYPPNRPPASPGVLERWADEIMADPVFHPQGRAVSSSEKTTSRVTGQVTAYRTRSGRLSWTARQTAGTGP